METIKILNSEMFKTILLMPLLMSYEWILKRLFYSFNDPVHVPVAYLIVNISVILTSKSLVRDDVLQTGTPYCSNEKTYI